MTKVTWKPGTMLSPVPPAMISCGTVEKPNVMTAAWTGIIASEPPLTYVSIRPERYSHELISESKEFVINLTTLALVSAADFCGVKSGRNVDKFKEMNLTALPCSEISAPQIAESPVSIECRVRDVQHYGTHDMFLAEIVAVNVDDQYIDEAGRLALEKAGLVAYVHGSYFTLGRNLGSFGFSVNKAKLKLAQKMASVEVEVKPSKTSVIEKAASKFGKDTRERKVHTGERRSSKSFGSEPKRRSFRDRDGDSRDGGERRPYPPRDRKPYNSDERRSYGSDERRGQDSGERRSYPPRDRKPYNSDERRNYGSDERRGQDSGERRSYPPRDRKPYNSDERRNYGSDERRGQDSGERRSYSPRDRKPFNKDGRSDRDDSRKTFDGPRKFSKPRRFDK